MPKLGMEPIRRHQLIEATITAIGRYGFGNTTVARISQLAGVSPGIIHHYFGGKNELLAAAMRELLHQLRLDLISRLRGVNAPRERLAIIIDTNFADRHFAPRVVTAWVAFWAQAPYVPELARLQRINSRRLQSHLRHALRRLLPPQQAREVAFALATLIDGLSLHSALNPGAVDAITARRLTRDYLYRLLTEPATVPEAIT